MKVSFANTLADICERIPGGDVDAVSDALGSDSRIGRKYLTGGMGFAGPCFPSDNVALTFLCRQIGASPDLLETNDRYNRLLAPRFVEKLAGLVSKGETVAMLEWPTNRCRTWLRSPKVFSSPWHLPMLACV